MLQHFVGVDVEVDGWIDSDVARLDRDFGDELILLDGPYYVYQQSPQARKESVGSFWKNLGNESLNAHHMSHYQF